MTDDLVDGLPPPAVALIETDAPSRGTGFLVAPGILLTALHVVADRRASPVAFDRKIRLTFAGGQGALGVPVEGAFDPLHDWALLRCEALPESAPLPPPLPLGRALVEERYSAYGYPDSKGDGLWARGQVSGRVAYHGATGVLQLYCKEAAAGARVHGLSGAPCLVGGAAVGVVRATLEDSAGKVEAGSLFCTPIEAVLAHERARALLPQPDRIRGLPGLPRESLGRLPERPFRYLAPYTEAEAPLFFGRDPEIRELYERLTREARPPVLLLYGASGVGKSSLLGAGLLPRMRAAGFALRMARRDATADLPDLLLQAVNARDPSEFRQKWGAVEGSEGPLLVVLDQAEEAYGHPHGDPNAELRALFTLLAELSSTAEPRPRGAVIVAFRKEWLPEIESRAVEAELSFGKLFVEPMKPEALREVLLGLRSDPLLRERYALEIEDRFVDQLVADLGADRSSSLAPTLQVILTRMWEAAPVTDRGLRPFTLAGYSKLRAEGLLLGDFLDRQLTEVARRLPEESDRGLVLELLRFHASDLGSSRTRSAEELARGFGGAPGAGACVAALKDAYLLSDPGGGASVGGARLAHDTLGPLVLERHGRSNRPGQEARRYLESYARRWRGGRRGHLLVGEPLKIVEAGVGAMRALSVDEARLLRVSRDAAAARDAARRQQEGDLRGALAGAAAVIARSEEPVLGDAAHTLMQALRHTAGRWMGHDPRWVRGSALRISPSGRYLAGGAAGGARLWDLGSERPKESKLEVEDAKAALEVLAWSATAPILAGAHGDFVYVWDLEAPEASRKEPRKKAWPCGGVEALALSPDNRWLAVEGRRRMLLWDLHDAEAQAPKASYHGSDESFASPTFSPDSRWLALRASRGDKGYIFALDLEGPGVSSGSFDHRLEAEDPRRPFELSADSRALRYRGPKGLERCDLVSLPPQLRSETFVPANDPLAARLPDEHGWSVDPDGWTVYPARGDQSRLALSSPDGAIRWAAADARGRLLTLGDAGTLRLWPTDLSGGALPRRVRLPADRLRVSALAADPGRSAIVASAQGKTATWMELGRPEDEALLMEHEEDITAMGFSPCGRYLALGGKGGALSVRDTRSGRPRFGARSLPTGAVGAVAIVAPGDRALLAAGTEGKNPRLWALHEPEEPPRALIGGQLYALPKVLRFAADGAHLLTAADDPPALLWPTQGAAEPRTLYAGWLIAGAFDEEAGRLYTLGAEGRLCRYAPPFAESEPEVFELGRLLGSAPPGHAAFDPSGRWLAIACGAEITVLDLRRDDPTQEPTHMTAKVEGQAGAAPIERVAISPTGEWLLLKTGEGRVFLSAVEPYERELPGVLLDTLSTESRAFAFTSDGRSAVVGGEDGVLRRWPLRREDLLAIAREVLGPR